MLSQQRANILIMINRFPAARHVKAAILGMDHSFFTMEIIEVCGAVHFYFRNSPLIVLLEKYLYIEDCIIEWYTYAFCFYYIQYQRCHIVCMCYIYKQEHTRNFNFLSFWCHFEVSCHTNLSTFLSLFTEIAD